MEHNNISTSEMKTLWVWEVLFLDHQSGCWLSWLRQPSSCLMREAQVITFLLFFLFFLLLLSIWTWAGMGLVWWDTPFSSSLSSSFSSSPFGWDGTCLMRHRSSHFSSSFSSSPFEHGLGWDLFDEAQIITFSLSCFFFLCPSLHFYLNVTCNDVDTLRRIVLLCLVTRLYDQQTMQHRLIVFLPGSIKYKAIKPLNASHLSICSSSPCILNVS